MKKISRIEIVLLILFFISISVAVIGAVDYYDVYQIFPRTITETWYIPLT